MSNASQNYIIPELNCNNFIFNNTSTNYYNAQNQENSNFTIITIIVKFYIILMLQGAVKSVW